ncbi:RNHCP domain-containing protein [Carnobacterium maltaromaticum]|uniref:RNHCP domain-containing protein n=1 Tax=Carnobacterium maltaromaticum TaxID=2751 RepID=UPI0010719B5A|nr:RNHCP domain-containing protein [Carnobacterium maltaromaticum]TFJ72373.1 hypothetical protein CKN94_14395 [Carnobacterium maltaromaticum]TFJ77286.1 hypothetical protein CKN97_14385 [Carnobacterium maltaromaticum]
MRKKENQGFTCINCCQEILPVTNGSYRNHCPYCLYSLHLDHEPGDRNSECKGIMKPISYRYKAKKGYQIEHCCLRCGKIQWNKVAEDTIAEDQFINFIKGMLFN